MAKPVFDNILQIGVVVRDARQTADQYKDLLGLDDWNVNHVDTRAGVGRDFHREGRPIQAKARIVWMNIGNVELELIEPQDEDSVYAIFLREKGPGIHHVMFSTPDYQSCAERMARHQISVMAGGELQQTQFQMFDTRETLGLICEIADGGALVPD
jgi:4-hydroxyphenylpyruvate dioxygenase-like putative hemolysin